MLALHALLLPWWVACGGSGDAKAADASFAHALRQRGDGVRRRSAPGRTTAAAAARHAPLPHSGRPIVPTLQVVLVTCQAFAARFAFPCEVREVDEQVA